VEKRVFTTTLGSIPITTNYLGGYQYKMFNNATQGYNYRLQFFPTAEGYVHNKNEETNSTTSVLEYVFNYTDHLGNVRLAYSDLNNDGVIANSEILEESNYYPFGLKQKGYNSNNTQTSYKYKYNGKELQDELGLNMYDYGSRLYDPARAGWSNIDPLAEKMRRFSPYNYCFNNPLRFTDPDGMAPQDIIISGNATFKQQAFNDLQKLSNDKLVLLPNGQVKIDPTNNVSTANLAVPFADKSLPVGTNLVADLISSSKVTTIVETTGGNETESTTDGSTTPTGNGPGADSTVKYNPNSTGSGIVNADGTEGRPAEIGLGHELAHAQDNKNGTSNDNINPTAKDPDSGRTGVLTNNEISVRKTDSAIRKEQGVVERKQL